MYDADNEIGMKLTEAQARAVREGMESARVLGIGGETLAWDECLDGDGDLCLDEDAYDSARDIAMRVK